MRLVYQSLVTREISRHRLFNLAGNSGLAPLLLRGRVALARNEFSPFYECGLKPAQPS